MKFSNLSLATVLLLAANLPVTAKPKTTTPVKIPASQLSEEPYRYNGAVLSGEFRGSGFCAWSNKTFFSAAHVVYQSGQWVAPPIWYPGANAAVLDVKTAIPSRGYYRWADYATLFDPADPEPTNFGRDVILAYAFEKIIKGKPAALNLNGADDLRKKTQTLITGYPADNLYDEGNVKGYFLHKTGPLTTTYERFAGNALTTTLESTGHGNSGGPIWTRNAKSKWVAAGVLVGGLPSESVVYAFSGDTNSLLRAVTPVIQSKIGTPIRDAKIVSTSTFFPYNQSTKIPDGRHQWTSFRIPVNTFPLGSKVKTAKLSLNIRTPHRGDLQVILSAPIGLPTDIISELLVHNEGGGEANNLVLNSEDYSENFAGSDANGQWILRVQDRLVGDIATLKSIMLEIAVDDAVETPPAP